MPASMKSRVVVLVRPVPRSFARATTQMWAGEPPDLAQARAQHAAYVEALEALGATLRVLPEAPDLPDSCFVEDQAVVAGARALVTRSGHPVRQREAPEVAAALRALGTLEVREMQAPATLDGGDVLRLGRTLFVGRSARTNEAGITALRQTFEPIGFTVRDLALPPSVLHLKCVCSVPDASRGLVVLAAGSLDPAVFTGPDLEEVILVPREEAYGANTLGWGGRVLVSEGYPNTRKRLHRLGLEPIALATSEIEKADGALTCLSVPVFGPALGLAP